METWYPPNLVLATHAHDVFNVSLVLAGTIEEESNLGTMTVGPGCVVFKPGGTEHRNRVGATGAVVFALRLDPRWKCAASRITSYLWCSHDGVERAMVRLYAFAHAMAHSIPMTAERAILRWLHGVTEDHPIPMRQTPPWMTLFRDSLHDSSDRSMSIRELARTFDAHPVYAARVFRRYLGSSPTTYARRVRIAQAAHQLIATDKPLAILAADLGFTDQSHFCRCFRAQVGLSPGEYRRLASPA